MRRKVVIVKRRPVIIKRRPVARRVIRVRSRPYMSPASEMIFWSSVPVWIQILILLIIVGGIAAGIYFGVKGDRDDDYEETIIIEERNNWWNNLNIFNNW
tara:strand:- start:763 stop:1062 length:300 start_codon:yes stop_codon:yes gene_type:complete